MRDAVEIRVSENEPRGYFTFARLPVSISFIIVFTRLAYPDSWSLLQTENGEPGQVSQIMWRSRNLLYAG